MHPDDKRALQEGLHRLSAKSVYFRFFSAKHDLTAKELAFFTEVDFVDHVALVAVIREHDVDLAIGVGRYILRGRSSVPAAEVAFAVDDAYHGLGIATILLRHLADIARAAGILEFRATVLGENRQMLEVLLHSGLPHTEAIEDDVIEVKLSLSGRGPAA